MGYCALLLKNLPGLVGILRTLSSGPVEIKRTQHATEVPLALIWLVIDIQAN